LFIYLLHRFSTSRIFVVPVPVLWLLSPFLLLALMLLLLWLLLALMLLLILLLGLLALMLLALMLLLVLLLALMLALMLLALMLGMLMLLVLMLLWLLLWLMLLLLVGLLLLLALLVLLWMWLPFLMLLRLLTWRLLTWRLLFFLTWRLLHWLLSWLPVWLLLVPLSLQRMPRRNPQFARQRMPQRMPRSLLRMPLFPGPTSPLELHSAYLYGRLTITKTQIKQPLPLSSDFYPSSFYIYVVYIFILRKRIAIQGSRLIYLGFYFDGFDGVDGVDGVVLPPVLLFPDGFGGGFDETIACAFVNWVFALFAIWVSTFFSDSCWVSFLHACSSTQFVCVPLLKSVALVASHRAQ